MRTRRLSLTKETLTELTTDELVGIAGAAAEAAQQVTPVRDCVDNLASKVVNCYTIFKPCPTI